MFGVHQFAGGQRRSRWLAVLAASASVKEAASASTDGVALASHGFQPVSNEEFCLRQDRLCRAVGDDDPGVDQDGP